MQWIVSLARKGLCFVGPGHREKRAAATGLIFAVLISAPGQAQEPDRDLHVVRSVHADELDVTNGVGLAFSVRAHSFIVLLGEEESARESSYSELGFMRPFGTLRRRVAMPLAIDNPLNATYDNSRDRFLFVRDDRLFFLISESDGAVENGEAGVLSGPLDLEDGRGLTSDPATGDIYVLDGLGPRLVVLGSDDVTDRVVPLGTVDLSHTGLSDLRGIAFDPTSGHLHTLSPGRRRLVELTPAGTVIASRDVSHLSLTSLTGLTFAPSTDSTDDPDVWNLYVNDGTFVTTPSMSEARSAVSTVRPGLAASTTNLFELSTIVPTTMAATETAALVQIIDSSAFSPPSPDSAGIAYLTSTGTLILTDSEVNEMSLYQGVNVFDLTLLGSVVDTFNTLSFSNEPTGVAFNPNDLHLFISDDTNPHVYELDPGLDGMYATPDDTVTSFPTTDFGSGDPEGVTYDTWAGVLFIVDGVDDEVYRVDPGGNGVFDGVAPSGDVQVTSFDTAGLGVSAPEGIAFDTDGGTSTSSESQAPKLRTLRRLGYCFERSIFLPPTL